jgi:hypothetical protein
MGSRQKVVSLSDNHPVREAVVGVVKFSAIMPKGGEK